MSRFSPEKSSFAQTCNLLSHYIKEKGSLRDLNLGINGEAETTTTTTFSGRSDAGAVKTTIDLFTDCHKSDQVSIKNNVKAMDLFPQYVMQDGITSSSKQAQAQLPKSAQMTIMYNGQVLVFDDLSDAKANEVMQLASKFVTPANTNTGFFIPSNNTTKNVENYGNSMPTKNVSFSGSVQMQDEMRQQLQQPLGSDLPIARRASLHRFLSKRKDRAIARGPYQLHSPSAESVKEQFDLNM